MEPSERPGTGSRAGTGQRDEPSRVRRVRNLHRENGTIWTVLFILERAAHRAGASRLSRAMWRKRAERELAHGLTGTNTAERNRIAWNEYDWAHAGEEWSESPEWRDSLIDEVMLSNLPDDAVALEIGPGAGRWSVRLRQSSRQLLLVDVSERPLELCRARFADDPGVSYLLNDGSNLPGVGDRSVDFVWSFDAFVHIAPVDQKRYVYELARVMRPGARAVIHHAGHGSDHSGLTPEGWRSSMTTERFKILVTDAGMRVIDQRDRWGPNGEHSVPEPGDVITIFEASSPSDP